MMKKYVCCLLKVKQTYLKHAIRSMASHFLSVNTLMSAAPVATSYMNIAWIKCQKIITICWSTTTEIISDTMLVPSL